jgi:hypothetical protein
VSAASRAYLVVIAHPQKSSQEAMDLTTRLSARFCLTWNPFMRTASSR